jgi:hypothetical protein
LGEPKVQVAGSPEIVRCNVVDGWRASRDRGVYAERYAECGWKCW